MDYIQKLAIFFIKYWDIIFGIIGILGFIYTIYDFYKKHGYKLGYFERISLPLLISKGIKEDLKITYKDQRITKLEGKTFRIFNYGDKEIRKEDLYKNNLSITAVNGKILNITIKIKDDNGNIHLKKIDDTKYYILFDYINISQIIDVNIIYDAKDVSINCKAAGMDSIRKFQEVLEIKDIISMIPSLLFFPFLCYIFYLKDWNESWFHALGFVLLTLFTLFTYVLYIYQLYIFWIGPKRKIINYQFPSIDNL